MLQTNDASFVQHIQVQHQRLQDAVHRIQRIIADLEDHSEESSHDLMQALTQLRDELVHHFREEESGGCLEESACRCPTLSPDVSRAFAEHPRLLQQLERILQQLALSPVDSIDPDEAGSGAIAERFAEFAAAVKRHESAENDILQRGFGIVSDFDD